MKTENVMYVHKSELFEFERQNVMRNEKLVLAEASLSKVESEKQQGAK